MDYQAIARLTVALMPPARPKTPFARHLRAALALRDETVEELARRIPAQYRISRGTLERIARGARPAKDWEVELFAELLGVPERFLHEGLAEAHADGGQVGELQELRHELQAIDRKLDVASLDQRLALIEAEIRRLAVVVATER